MGKWCVSNAGEKQAQVAKPNVGSGVFASDGAKNEQSR